jgi:alcohol-forming fatty acyl-CoA reductase
MESRCFEYAKKLNPNFEQFISNTVTPISGDLVFLLSSFLSSKAKEGLALSPEDEQIMIQDLDIIINSAASTGFNDRLDAAITSNIKSVLNLIEFAKKCNHLQLFLQISTCYANSDKE